MRGAKRRSNPDCLRGKILDCFVARAPRNDGGESSSALTCKSGIHLVKPVVTRDHGSPAPPRQTPAKYGLLPHPRD
ncbi:hypothetical protein FOM02_08150 [Bradyrhizobium sp. SEMIA]|nr:hypothetical protein FOM02_08150 [Bradyrhizobium sp. SEMIA]